MDGWIERDVDWMDNRLIDKQQTRETSQVLFISLGFPYRDEQEVSADLAKLLDPIISSEMSPLSPTDQLILMTHNGPTNSCKKEK